QRGPGAVVEAEQTGRLQRGRGGGTRPVRGDAGMYPGQQRDQDRQRDGGVQQAEQAAEPPGGPAEQRERGGVAEREYLTDAQVHEEAREPGPVRVLGDQRSQQQRQVEAGNAGQLGRDQDRGQRGRREQPEQRPS